jgi:organic hydroperoxide reductase OsmC/OhrA
VQGDVHGRDLRTGLAWRPWQHRGFPAIEDRRMSTYAAQVRWHRQPQEAFTDQRYSRRHVLRFDGGIELPASSSPGVVPLPMSDASAVDPEELFVASLASCHMLWFLSLAAQRGYRVERYEDDAVGTMARDARGRLAMTEVVLRPAVAFGGEQQPDGDALTALHHAAHDRCFIANSVLTTVRCEPRPAT